MENLSTNHGASRRTGELAVAPFEGDVVLAALKGETTEGRGSVVIRAPEFCGDRTYQFHSPSSLSQSGELMLGFPLDPSFSQIDKDLMREALETAVRRSCGPEYSVVSGEGRSGRPGLIIERSTEAGGLSFQERVAEFDYRWRGFVEYRFNPQASRVTAPEEMNREGHAALTILRDYIDSYRQLSGETLPNETFRLSVER